jgi:ribonuclease HI
MYNSLNKAISTLLFYAGRALLDSLIIYTDGGCRGNPGPGGWAFIIKTGGMEISGSGGDNYTTNNKMELTAVIRSMEAILEDSDLSKKSIDLHTDSQYVKNGISSWINNWIKNGWKTAAKKPVKNKELWIRLKEVSDQLDVKWKWVKGHAGDPLNEACDNMVNEEMNKL